MGMAARPYLWLTKGLVWLLPADDCPRWLLRLALRLLDELAKRSRADSDARFAMDVLKVVHVGDRDYSPYPMFRERIVEQMGREPDEEIPYDGGIMQPKEPDDDMFWNRSKPVTGSEGRQHSCETAG